MTTGPDEYASVEVALLCDLPIGVLAWRAPDPALTVIVKATFSFQGDGSARLADQQEPLCLDQPSAIGEAGDLDRASDFVPIKRSVDVLLSGNAYASAPSQVMAVGFMVDGLQKQFYALAGEPSQWAPLLPAYLRCAPSSASEAVRVGARAIWTRDDVMSGLLAEDGLPVGPLPRGFDYSIFNVAPADQQTTMLSTSALLTLDGLTSGGLRRSIKLPGIRPRVFALPERGSARSTPPQEIALRCDTLWIDGGRELCTLTWRGLYVPMEGTLPFLLVATEGREEALSLAAVKRRLADAVVSIAVTPAHLRHGIEANPVADHGARTAQIQDEPTRVEVREAPRDSAPSPTMVTSPRDMPTLKLLTGAATLTQQTSELDAVALSRAIDAALPFQGERAKPPVAAPFALGGSRLAAMVLGSPPAPPLAPPPPDRPSLSNARTLPFAQPSLSNARTLPFAQPTAEPSVLPFAPPSAEPSVLRFAPPSAEPSALPFSPPPPSSSPSSGLPFTAAAVPSALPFTAVAPAPIAPGPIAPGPIAPGPIAPGLVARAPIAPGPIVLSSAPPFSPWAPVITPSVRAPDAAPDPVAATPIAPTPEVIAPAPIEAFLLPLDVYAVVKASIWGDGLSLAMVLERHSVDQDVWYENERRIAKTLAEEAKHGKQALAIELREALRQARDRPPPDGDRPLGSIDSYLAICAAVDGADDPIAVLAARGITAAEWHRLNRRFQAKAENDPALRAKLGKKLGAIRKALNASVSSPVLKPKIRRERPPAGARRVAANKRT